MVLFLVIINLYIKRILVSILYSMADFRRNQQSVMKILSEIIPFL